MEGDRGAGAPAVNALAPGHTVRLASGGPLMTVKSVDDVCAQAHCEWFDGEGAVRTRRFTLDSLRREEG